jgi:hypothetical protein
MRCGYVAFIALSLLGCQDEPRVPVRRPPPLEIVPTQPVLECRFDPVTLPDGGEVLTGQDMCFTSAEPDPWWMRLTPASAEDAGPRTPAPASDADAGSTSSTTCPSGMLLVEGEYCPNARHRCLSYIDEEQRGTFLAKNRCRKFDEKVECLAPREHRRFCIDRDEYVPKGAELPLADQSWSTTKELCESLGKRLCFESEWVFACEGEKMLPYPYGFERNAKLCNHDLTELSKRGKMLDKRVRPDARPECISPFGVRNMVGNVDEWTYLDGFVKPWRAALKGGWWLAGRNNCRAATTGHDEFYHGPQTGVRCCANAR